VLPPTLRPAAELTSSAPFRPEGRDDELPALAFCLLFRFQGAVARGTSQTRARCHVPRGPGTVREADVYVSRRHTGATTPGQEKTSMRWCDFLPRRSSRYRPCRSATPANPDVASIDTPLARYP